MFESLMIIAGLSTIAASYYIGYLAGKTKVILETKEGFIDAVQKSKDALRKLDDPELNRLLLDKAYRD